MKRYSVIVPFYNSYNYVADIVDWFELELDKRDDIELILVDDGSTKSYVHNVSNDNIKLIVKENGGVSSARNIGLSEASGEYVLFLDSDDSYVKSVFSMIDEKVIDSPDVVVFSGNLNYEGEIIPFFNNTDSVLNGDSTVKGYCLKELKCHVCSIVIRADFLDQNKIAFDETVHYSEDILFLLEVFKLSKVCVFSKCILYIHFVREGTATRTVMREKILSHFQAFKNIKKLFCGTECDNEIDFFLATCYVHLLVSLFKVKANNISIALEILDNSNMFIGKSVPYRFGKYYLFIVAARFMVASCKLMGPGFMKLFLVKA